MGILSYQIGIFIVIQIASSFGKKSRNTAVILISIFTVLQVYTDSLMILQFGTIILSFIISQSLFFSKKDKNVKTEKTKHYSKPIPNIIDKYLDNENSKVKTNNIKNYDEIRDKFLENISKEIKTEKKSFIGHLECNFKDFENELQSDNYNDQILAYDKVIERFEKSVIKYENRRKSGDVSYVISFENMNYLHKMILKMLLIAKSEFETENTNIDLDLFKEVICRNFNKERGTFKL